MTNDNQNPEEMLEHEITATEFMELLQKMSDRERKDILLEVADNFIEFHFEVNQFYYVLFIEPDIGAMSLWSGDKQKEIFTVE